MLHKDVVPPVSPTMSTPATAAAHTELKMAVALASDKADSATPADATAAAAATPAQPATPPVKSEVSIRRTTPSATRAPVRDIASLFDAMNQALALGNKNEARQQLDAIESSLPESSVARLRAEAWYAHQTGDLDAARLTYRKVLGKLQGDEYAALNLVAIERQAGQTEQAREVLVRATRSNPDSVALRNALAQLSSLEGSAK